MDASNATSALPHVDYTLGCRPYASPSIAAACAHVTNNPLCERGDTDYLRFYYCSDSFVGAAPPALKLPILALWCLVLFVAIATVAGNYFAPSVERISARLRLSEDVAGATILALGGAAPDIFTQAAALLESDTPDLRLALSESVGAGLFVSNLGKALTVLVGLSRGGRVVRRQDSNPRARGPDDVVTVEAFPYLRDCLTYAVALLVAYASILDGVVSTGEAATFVALYALYVAIVLRGPIFFGLALGDESVGPRHVPRRRARAEAPRKRWTARRAPRRGRPEKCAAVVELADVSELHRRGNESTRNTVFAGTSGGVRAGKNLGTRTSSTTKRTRTTRTTGTRGLLADGSCQATPRVASRLKTTRSRTERRGFEVWPGSAASPRRRSPREGARRARHGADDAPGRRARAYHRTSRRGGGVRAVIFLWATRLLADAVAAAPAAFWSGYLVWILAWWRIVLRRCPPGGMDTRNSILAQALAFVQGITWMRACADELVGLFQAAGRAAGVRESLLGATVMAWGASAGDLGGMLALARAGYARMAIAASLAGPVCQLSIGTGFSMLLVRFRGETLRADFADNMRFLALYGVAASVAFAVIVPKLAFALDRRAAFVVMGCYAIAVGVFVALALGEEEH